MLLVGEVHGRQNYSRRTQLAKPYLKSTRVKIGNR